MKLVLADSKYLKDSISVISELVNEARFKVTRNGLELVAMDPANVAMVVYKLLSSCFTEYDVTKEQDLAVNLANLKSILKRASPSDIVTLETGEDSKLHVQLRSNTTRTFSLPLIELEEKEQRVPNLAFPVSISTPSTVLDDSIADVDIVGESVAFIVDKDVFMISAEGDLSKAHIEVKGGEDVKIRNEATDKVRAKYSVEYLKKMIQGSKLADTVSISFAQDYPLKLEYKVIDKLSLAFILAPRVEND
ncbi:proliferating cell nuclear antigen (pcna) [Candidatus Woesearchaeota archaeon]|nr:proliferating cell nuclear antigen (pcna) [Candidatus Woesearchaeota archaeon]